MDIDAEVSGVVTFQIDRTILWNHITPLLDLEKYLALRFREKEMNLNKEFADLFSGVVMSLVMGSIYLPENVSVIRIEKELHRDYKFPIVPVPTTVSFGTG